MKVRHFGSVVMATAFAAWACSPESDAAIEDAETSGELPPNVVMGDADAVEDFAIEYSDSGPGSTHEITFLPGSDSMWLTGQSHDAIVELTTDGETTVYPLPQGSGPHGIVVDEAGRLWVTLEFAGSVARLDDELQIAEEYDVSLNCTTCPRPIDTHPHGLAPGPDGESLWFTGKATGTIGKIAADGSVAHYATKAVGSVPIYVRGGADGNVWYVELVGNAIGRISDDGQIDEFPIETHNSRPIALVTEPGEDRLWFTQEAGNNVARIDMDGRIVEIPVPKLQPNVILAGLAFDDTGHLWIQQYVDPNDPEPPGPDYIIRADRAISSATDASDVTFTFYEIPTRRTTLHRIVQGPDGNIWFTELAQDRVGVVRIED